MQTFCRVCLQPTKPFLQQKYYLRTWKGFYSHKILYVERVSETKTNPGRKECHRIRLAEKSGGKSNLGTSALHTKGLVLWHNHREGHGSPSPSKHKHTKFRETDYQGLV